MELINKSLLIHSAWNIATNKDPLLTSIMKSKYFPDSSFWTAPSNMPRSVFWSSVLQVKHYLNENTTMQINQGNSSIWFTPWMDHWSTIHDSLIMPITNLPLPANISDLWLQGTKEWSHQFLSTTFEPQVVQAISALQVHQSQQEDILRWKPAQNGKCSSKSAYNHLHNLQEHTLPQQGARSISSSTLCILAKVWKGKTIPPFLKTFAWRLLRRALATADRVVRFSNHINKYCSRCGNTEK
jgi:hypothetical protein